MQFKDTLRKLVLLSITALAVFSCITVDKSLGENFIPGDQDLGLKMATLRLPLISKMADSLQADGDLYASVGHIRTEEFGLASFMTAANITPTKTKVRFGEDPQIKSVYFVAPVGAFNIIGNNDAQANMPQNIIVYRTNKVLIDTLLRPSSLKRTDYDSKPLNITTSTYFGGDSIKVYLNNDFGKEILSATEKELDSLDLFVKRFKGLVITAEESIGNMIGGRLNHMDYQNAYVGVTYNFQPRWAAGLQRKDTTVILALGYGKRKMFFLNSSTYSSKPGYVQKYGVEAIPMEGVAGLKPYISAKELKKLLNKWQEDNGYSVSTVLISRASFHFPFEMPTDFNMKDYPTMIFPSSMPKKGVDVERYAPVEDLYVTGNPGGVMNRSLCEYYGDISIRIQKIIVTPESELTPKDDIWIMPMATTSDSYGNTFYNVNTFNYTVGYINSPNAARYPTLKLLYSLYNNKL